MWTLILRLVAFGSSGVGRWLFIGLAGLALVGGLYLKIYSDGAASVKAKQDRESLNNLRNRTETNETVNRLPGSDLDSELGRWMLPDN